jgi:two-component system, LuxR family, response regulator FixJ
MPDPADPASGSGPSLYIVDDEPAVARIVARAAETIGFSTRTFSSATSFLEIIDELQPGCVLLDIKMPRMNGLELLEKLKEQRPEWPVVMLTGHAEVGSAVQSFRAGAVHFLSKPFKKAELLEALTEAAAIGQRRRRLGGARQALEKLTKREREILAALSAGKRSKTIAWELGISVRTVDLHRANILSKLSARNTSQAVALVKAGDLLGDGADANVGG